MPSACMNAGSPAPDRPLYHLWRNGIIRILCTLLPLPLSLTISACAAGGDAGSGSITVRDSAGVAIFELHGADLTLAPDLRPLADLVPSDSALSPVPWGIAADPASGRIYIADRGGTRIATFDRSGRYTGDLGRAGGGPGEFRNLVALALALDPAGTLAAWDAGRGILSRWSPEGSLIDERRTVIDYWGPGFLLGPAGRLWVARTTTGLTPELVDILDPTDGYLGTLTLPAIPVAFLSDSRFIAISVRETGEVVATLFEIDDELRTALAARTGGVARLTGRPERAGAATTSASADSGVDSAGRGAAPGPRRIP